MKLVKSLVTAAAAALLSTAALANATISVSSANAPTSFIGLTGNFNPAGVNTTALFAEYGNTFQKNATVGFSAATPIKLTFVGKEAGNKNTFGVGIRTGGASDLLFNTSANGSSVFSSAGAGVFSFFFYDITTSLEIANPSIAIGVAQSSTNTSKALFVFNDNGSADGDYDDMVVSVTAVPEPETYAMMLAGLGLMGAVARRRKAKQA